MASDKALAGVGETVPAQKLHAEGADCPLLPLCYRWHGFDEAGNHRGPFDPESVKLHRNNPNKCAGPGCSDCGA